MGDNGRAAAADVLGQGDADPIDLRLAGVAAELQRSLDYLVDAGGADRMTASFQPAHGADRHPTGGLDLAFQAQAHALSRQGKTASLQ